MLKDFNEAYIFQKPHYWKKIVEHADDNDVSDEGLKFFIKGIYMHVTIDGMTWREFEDMDDFEKDGYLDSLAVGIAKEYESDREGDDIDYDSFENFVSGVLWERWFPQFLLAINTQIEKHGKGIADIDIFPRSILIIYSD